MSIPKVIHYCWFGNKAIPKRLQYCIQSWKQLLPDYTFKLWNETNTEFDCEFIRTAYAAKKWAFVADYVRIKAVYDFGGIYMDTDMLLLKSLDDFLDNKCFFVAEHSLSIGSCIFGATKHNLFIKLCLNTYHAEEVVLSTSPKRVTNTYLKTYNAQKDFKENIRVDGLTIYKPAYFYALPYQKLYDIHQYKKYLTEASYGVHLWEGSWHTYSELVLLRRKEYNKALKKIGDTIFKEKKLSLAYLRKVMVALRDSLRTKDAFK
ncbi:glycosyltransferase [Rasiella sp. SM2506]|uniref:glycosyltransferase n=1 Tax=Rasiella sp. SM2506 TaxID=3423914 RepID=UPI003D7C1093